MNRVSVGLLVLAGATSAACASATAKAAPDRPPLEVPAPPMKVIEPSPRPEPAPDPVPELPPPQPTNSRPPRQPPRETAKPDPKPEATTPTETPAPPVTPVTPAPQLRPANTPEPSEAAKQAQIAVERSRQVLSSLNAKQVPRTKKAVFDDAHRMQSLAEEALKKSDFENAKKLADKVESTARELGAR
jgi:hypothetical protein